MRKGNLDEPYAICIKMVALFICPSLFFATVPRTTPTPLPSGGTPQRQTNSHFSSHCLGMTRPTPQPRFTPSIPLPPPPVHHNPRLSRPRCDCAEGRAVPPPAHRPPKSLRRLPPQPYPKRRGGDLPPPSLGAGDGALRGEVRRDPRNEARNLVSRPGRKGGVCREGSPRPFLYIWIRMGARKRAAAPSVVRGRGVGSGLGRLFFSVAVWGAMGYFIGVCLSQQRGFVCVRHGWRTRRDESPCA